MGSVRCFHGHQLSQQKCSGQQTLMLQTYVCCSSQGGNRMGHTSPGEDMVHACRGVWVTRALLSCILKVFWIFPLLPS